MPWLWGGYFAFGELNDVNGLPDSGKSQLLPDIAARVSRGWKMPPHPLGVNRDHPKPRNVLFRSDEDQWETMILPRLIADGADLDHVFRLDKEPITLPQDIGYLEREIEKRDARVMVLDPITAVIGKADGNMESEVRPVLHRLRSLAERTEIAILYDRHWKKGKDIGIFRGGGSTAWTAVPRIQHVIGPHPEVDGAWALACSKMNAAKKPRSLGFKIVGESISVGELRDIRTSKIEWLGPVDVTADDLAMGPVRGRHRKTDGVVETMQSLLEDGPMDSALLQKKVMDATGVSESTFKRAKREAGIVSEKRGFGGTGGWTCSLP